MAWLALKQPCPALVTQATMSAMEDVFLAKLRQDREMLGKEIENLSVVVKVRSQRG